MLRTGACSSTSRSSSEQSPICLASRRATHTKLMFFWLFFQFPGGNSDPYMMSLSSFFSYPEIGLTISCASLAHLTQSIASANAKLCICHRKALHPSSQSFASVPTNVCGKRRLHLGDFPMFFSEPFLGAVFFVCKWTIILIASNDLVIFSFL